MRKQAAAPQNPPQGILLTKHEGEAFRSQTVYIAGHGFQNCTFDNCTLVVTNTPFLMSGCRINNCNWRIECDVLWGDPRSRAALRQLIDLIDAPVQGNGAAAPAQTAEPVTQ